MVPQSKSPHRWKGETKRIKQPVEQQHQIRIGSNLKKTQDFLLDGDYWRGKRVEKMKAKEMWSIRPAKSVTTMSQSLLKGTLPEAELIHDRRLKKERERQIMEWKMEKHREKGEKIKENRKVGKLMSYRTAPKGFVSLKGSSVWEGSTQLKCKKKKIREE